MSGTCAVEVPLVFYHPWKEAFWHWGVRPTALTPEQRAAFDLHFGCAFSSVETHSAAWRWLFENCPQVRCEMYDAFRSELIRTVAADAGAATDAGTG